MAKVTLARVPTLFTGSSLVLSATPPVGLAYVAASLRSHGNDVVLIDSVGEAIDRVALFDERHNLFVNGLSIDEILERIPADTEIIGVGLDFSQGWPLQRRFCHAIRDRFPDAILIGGGEHATALPRYCLENCDALDCLVIGEGEETACELVTTLESSGDLGEVKGIAYRDANGGITVRPRGRILNIDDLPWPAWDLMPLEAYLGGGYSFGVNLGRTMPIVATRGCPYRCTFCSSPSMWTRRWIARSPENVVDEIEAYVHRYGAQNFDFYDLTFVIRRAWLERFCGLLRDRGLSISWQLPSGTRSEVLDTDATALMAAAGCRNVSYAPESGSVATLERIDKRIELNVMLGSMKAARRSGLNVKANIVVGFPGETRRDVLQTFRFILQMAIAGVDDISVWPFVPYPGTVLFEELRQNGQVAELTDDYFLSLFSYADLHHARSWNENIPTWQLGVLRIAAMMLFYAVTYATRPLRPLVTAYNILVSRPRSRLEMIVDKAIFRHWRASSGTAGVLTDPHKSDRRPVP